MTYSKKVENALATCKNLKEVDEIMEAIEKTSQINRRTNEGRTLTKELIALCNQKAQELINNGENPF